jgi:hypothetical protein
MRCTGGKHEWTDRLDAERRCSPEWERVTRWASDAGLDPVGVRPIVIGGSPVFHGRLRVEPRISGPIARS